MHRPTFATAPTCRSRKSHIFYVAFAVAIAALIFVATANAAEPPTLVVRWNQAALQGVRDSKLGPPMVSRALAIVHTCIFDAWAPYDRTAVGTVLRDKLRQPHGQRTLPNKKKAISFAAYRALVDLFPDDKQSVFDPLMQSLGYDPSDNSVDPQTPSGVGNLACTAVLDMRHTDGSNQLGDLNPGAYSDWTGYVPVNSPTQVNDPNRWQPLSVPTIIGTFVTQTFVGAQWYLVTPFALTSDAQFRSLIASFGPAQNGSQEFLTQAQELVGISANLTDEEKVIAEYWADGPHSELPPGHWDLFAQFVSARDHHHLDDDVKMFFALTNAIFDGGIVAWDTKRAFDSVRPITAIRFLFAGTKMLCWGGPFQGTQLLDGGDWKPYQPATFPTPPFPEYISGHSTFSAAGAEILKRFSGSDAFGGSVTMATGSSKIEPGAVPAAPVTLKWPTFSEAAEQAGISRRYGGIHFEAGDFVGRMIGRVVATQVWDKAQAYIQGTAK